MGPGGLVKGTYTKQEVNVLPRICSKHTHTATNSCVHRWKSWLEKNGTSKCESLSICLLIIDFVWSVDFSFPQASKHVLYCTTRYTSLADSEGTLTHENLLRIKQTMEDGRKASSKCAFCTDTQLRVFTTHITQICCGICCAMSLVAKEAPFLPMPCPLCD